MNRIISMLFVTLVIIFFGANDAMAKDDVKKEQVVEYSLVPAPHCQNCVNKIKGNLRFEKGVKNVVVNLEKKSVAITFSPKNTNEEKLVGALKKIGYTATPYSDESTKTEGEQCDNCK